MGKVELMLLPSLVQRVHACALRVTCALDELVPPVREHLTKFVLVQFPVLIATLQIFNRLFKLLETL